MRKTTLLSTIFCGCALAVSANAAKTESLTFKPQAVFKQRNGDAPAAPAKSEFVFKDRNGKTVSAPIVTEYQKNRIVRPLAKIDPKAGSRSSPARPQSQTSAPGPIRGRVAGVTSRKLFWLQARWTSYPKTALAKQAGEELVRDYGFKKLPIRDPYKAPVGSVLVYYKGRNRPGHVEIRTKTGFVSDFRSKDASRHPLLGVYGKG